MINRLYCEMVIKTADFSGESAMANRKVDRMLFQ